MKTGIVCFMAVILVWRGDILVAQPYINYAAGKPVTASNPTKQLQLINDESLISGEARANPGGELFWIAIDLTADFGIGGMHLHLDQAGILPLRNFYFEYRTEGKWLPLPDGRFKNNFSAELALDLPESISMNAIRLLTDSENVFGIVEWQLWGTEVPALPHGVQRTVAEPYIPDKHWVCVNQVAYNHGQPKGFTVPTAKSDLPFQILERSSGNVVYTGRLSKGKGDFTDFNPESSTASEFFIRIPDGDGLPGADSYPFVIGRRAIQRMAYGPNVAFWNDVRSMVGSHPSAYGGTAWRDGTYYTYEVPAMILMYLSDPEAFENMPVTIDWNADKGRILAPDYSFIRARNDKDALHTVRTYYQDFPPPMHNKVPDIVQAIRFGAAWNLIDPVSHDPSGDILGERMHGQTIEQFAFFLFAYPAFRHQISQDFYQMVLDSTMQWWEEAGLFEVITTVGGPKGRHCPGHSILPNLLMYEVAMREQIAQPERFLEAARKQTEWIIEEADWYNPAFTKGQRISEHKLVTGLSVFLLNYPEEAPCRFGRKAAGVGGSRGGAFGQSLGFPPFRFAGALDPARI